MIVKILNKKMIYYIYCDESGTTAHRYMIIGGICFKQEHSLTINNTINKFREENNMKSEIKFIKISNAKETEYKKFIDYIFALINNNYMEFKAIVIDKSKINENEYKKIKNIKDKSNKEVKENFFQTMYFELLCNSFTSKIKEQNSNLYFYLDKRNSKYDLQNMKQMIQNANNSKHYKKQNIKNIAYIDSKKSNFIQIVDILIGAVNYFYNDKENISSNTNNTKKEITNYIKEKSGIDDWNKGTKPNYKRFNLWLFKPYSNNS